jgi:hypothetical protein
MINFRFHLVSLVAGRSALFLFFLFAWSST